MQRLIVIAGCLLALAGCATTSESRFSGIAASRMDCVQTGTRIRLKDGECSPSPGRSYSHDELQGTGAMTVVEALGKLDPRF
jgi:hypothetical protein